MKITTQTRRVNPQRELLACFDVSKASLNLFCHVEHEQTTVRLEDQLPNATGPIEQTLTRLQRLADTEGFEAVRVLCESTGGYERALLQTARRLGCRTALVNPEHVCRLKNVESNDTGKTDQKDPRVIDLVARLGKTQRHRRLPEIYHVLRRLTSFYDQEERTLAAIRTRLQALIVELFPDYDKSAAFTFDTTGRALFEAYGFNPYRIDRAGYKRFQATIKRRVRFVRFATLEQLFAWAEASVRHALPAALVEELEARLRLLFSDLLRHEGRCAAYKQEIECLGAALNKQGLLPKLDEAVSGLTLFNLARLLGQTGPLADFASKRALLRYAGMNLRERTSGQYRGQTRLSKKGRPLLRKVLGQTVFPLLRRDRLYGAYYHKKRQGGQQAQQAIVAVMRKFLGVLWALARSGEAFDLERFSRSESQYRRLCQAA
jgi:transposase